MDVPDDLPNDGQDENQLPDYLDGLSDRERVFLLEYLKDKNRTQAVLRAGFTDNYKSASEIGSRLLRNVKVLAARDAFLAECTMSAQEAIKNISDIASSSLNDYMVPKKVQARELSEQYVTVLLAQAKEQIQRIREFIDAEGLAEKGGGAFKRQIRQLQEKVLEYQTDIEQYGNDVTRLAPGRPVIVEQMELDLVALAKDKERGRVKTLQPTEYGWKVEMYAADTNLERLLKYHGKLPELHQHSGPGGGAIPIDQETKSTVYIIDTTGGYKVPEPDDDYSSPEQ